MLSLHRNILNSQKCSKILKKYYCANNNEFYDIIIAGGGMVGTTLASTLGNNQL